MDPQKIENLQNLKKKTDLVLISLFMKTNWKSNNFHAFSGLIDILLILVVL